MTIKKLVTGAPNASAIQKNITLKPRLNRLLNYRSRAEEELPNTQNHGGRERRLPTSLRQVEVTFSNQILSKLDGDDRARLTPHLESVSLGGGEELVHPGRPASYVYFPEDATISQFQGLTDGSTAEIVMIGREGLVGLDALFGSAGGTSSSFWTQAITSGTAFRVKTDVLTQEFQHSPTLRTLLLGYANTYIALIAQRVSCNIRHVAGARFCTWLLMLRDRAPGDELRLTQEQIAVCLGINRPTVTTFAKMLRDDGLIDYTRGKIRIRDRRRLEAAACECYATVKSYMPCLAMMPPVAAAADGVIH